MNNPGLPPSPQRKPARNAPGGLRIPAVSARNILLLLCLIMLTAACGRRPSEPTPLPLGTRVDQPTPDFSAPAQTETAPQSAESLRTRLSQQQTQTAPTAAPAAAAPAPTSSILSVQPDLAVFSRPTALGILSGGGLLYSAPAGPIAATLQVGATLTITGRSADGAWFAAYLADGVAGWVPAAQVRVFGDANQLETVQESLGPAVVATLIAEASKPQESISAVTVRLTATTAAATATGDASPQTTPVPPAAAPEITGPAITIIVEGANLRTGPGTDYPVVGGLYQDEKAPLLGRNQNGDWLQVQLPETIAWIFAPLVETTLPIAELPLIDPPPTPEP